jgi:hypothetical protein
MRVYHFIGRKYGLDDLQKRRIKIATINDLNDPFELLGPASSDKNIRRRFQLLKEQLARNRGMLCFSRNWRNPVQWSHYADKHFGLCLGFEIPKKYLTLVRYRDKRLEPDVATIERGERDPAANREMLKVLTTKYSHWRYENELRLFVALNDKDTETGFFFCDFSDSLSLREVIVGAFSTISRNELANVLGDIAPKIAVCKARLSFRSFAVVRQRNKTLWK